MRIIVGYVMTKKCKWMLCGVFAVLFFVSVVLVTCVDVADVGPQGTEVGMSTVNKAVADAIGFNETIYKVSDILGYMSIVTVVAYAADGLIQLIKRKSLLKVDREVIALGVLYLIIFILYVAFEFVVVNYRPVIMPGETAPEASFPSSHTLMTCVVMAGAVLAAKSQIASKKLRTVVQVACVAVMVLTVVFRFMSGVHWFTDIVSSLLLSAALVFAYSAAAEK